MDADHSGFSFPLEHSFEVGENLLFLLIIALKLTAAANDEGKWINMKHDFTQKSISFASLCINSRFFFTPSMPCSLFK